MAAFNDRDFLDSLIEKNVGGGDTISFKVRNPLPAADQIRGEFVSLGHSQKSGDFILVSVTHKIPVADICLETLEKPEDKPSGYVKPDHL